VSETEDYSTGQPSRAARMDQICTLLRERTCAGRIRWRRVESSRTIEFKTLVAGYRVHLRETSEQAMLEIRNNAGQIVEERTGTNAEALFRSVRQADEAADRIIQDLIDQLDAMLDRSRCRAPEKPEHAGDVKRRSRLPWLRRARRTAMSK
jgi:hypothetical protein